MSHPRSRSWAPASPWLFAVTGPPVWVRLRDTWVRPEGCLGHQQHYSQAVGAPGSRASILSALFYCRSNILLYFVILFSHLFFYCTLLDFFH